MVRRATFTLLSFLGTLLFVFALQGNVYGASQGEDDGQFNPAPVILHHISDAHKWHIIGDINLYLPVILYSPEEGLSVFMSSRFEEGTVDGYQYDHGKIKRADGASFYDFSITKNVASMLFSCAVIAFIFISVARQYEKRKKQAPKGMQSLLEPLINFVRYDIAQEAIGEKKYQKFVPYLLTLFFFIWFNNLLGLVPFFPGAANVTGNINVTAALAFISLVVINFSGNKHYWKHIFWPPGVPIPVKLPLALMEFIGIFTKPFALMIRLFANISAGHIIILSLISLIFLIGQSVGGLGLAGVSIAAILFTVFMFCLELLVAALQAYIFTILTALFIGQAVEEPEHH